MIYLAAPYSHYNPEVVQSRMEKIYSLMAQYMKKGEHIFTPLFMHEVVIRHDLPNDFRYWGAYCLDHLKRCDKIIVFQLSGWESSRGVSEEILFAIKNHIEVEYLSEEEWRQSIITNPTLLSSQSSTTA